ncbi:uncharacterized protein LAESUDRAFT_810453 [Laetiporus sulphureus 93-53]|uniref:Uncharacterized protein n=1 Tax=Laetiporus sulphureus 93-53 TaxID=1314785 RepID=A0A165FU81_9APHY|nr:uncharacterized protein LAESUDRAFT_810453 [Laetiporus sulphureus 93-53]KZT09416.1 hypothetical protein LAESUDRAFT_810453 [Laetiporus sulphureus 93-53]
MPPSFGFLIPTLAAVLLSTSISSSAQQNVAVDADSPFIDFQGIWFDEFGDNGPGHTVYAASTGSSFTFTFIGSAIYYHSVINPNAGQASITLDSGDATIVDESVDAHKGEESTPAILWYKTGLNPSESHTMSLSYVGSGELGGGYVELYYLEYTEGGTSSATVPSSTGEANATASVAIATGTLSTELASGHSRSNTVLVAGLAGGLGGLFLLSTFVYLALYCEPGSLAMFPDAAERIGLAKRTSLPYTISAVTTFPTSTKSAQATNPRIPSPHVGPSTSSVHSFVEDQHTSLATDSPADTSRVAHDLQDHRIAKLRTLLSLERQPTDNTTMSAPVPSPRAPDATFSVSSEIADDPPPEYDGPRE